MPCVVIPWRATPARVHAFEYVTGWWKTHRPLWPIITVDTAHERYNLAAARNLGVAVAAARGHKLVVLSDADAVLADPTQVDYAVEYAQRGDFVLPFTGQRYLDQTETVGLLEQGTRPLEEGGHGNGAMYVCSVDTYQDIGGSDERFSGWGGEDDGIVAAASTLGTLCRVPGVVWSLWHADERRPVGTEEHRPNAELAQRYWDAAGNIGSMRLLIAERAKALA